MKLMTMNVHSLVEKDYERKLVEFADVAAREKPDILALQEVSQLMSEAVWPDEELEGFVRCREYLCRCGEAIMQPNLPVF